MHAYPSIHTYPLKVEDRGERAREGSLGKHPAGGEGRGGGVAEGVGFTSQGTNRAKINHIS